MISDIEKYCQSKLRSVVNLLQEPSRNSSYIGFILWIMKFYQIYKFEIYPGSIIILIWGVLTTVCLDYIIHESFHNTLFEKPSDNYIFGALLSITHVLPMFSIVRGDHIRHHTFRGTNKDPYHHTYIGPRNEHYHEDFKFFCFLHCIFIATLLFTGGWRTIIFLFLCTGISVVVSNPYHNPVKNSRLNLRAFFHGEEEHVLLKEHYIYPHVPITNIQLLKHIIE
jgi:hypothetical protein